MKKLTRNRDDKWLGGVCSGIADYTGVDANLIRLITAVATIMGFGTVIIAYIAAWILMPANNDTTVWADATDAPTTTPAPPPPSA